MLKTPDFLHLAQNMLQFYAVKLGNQTIYSLAGVDFWKWAHITPKIYIFSVFLRWMVFVLSHILNQISYKAKGGYEFEYENNAM